MHVGMKCFIPRTLQGWVCVSILQWLVLEIELGAPGARAIAAPWEADGPVQTQLLEALRRNMYLGIPSFTSSHGHPHVLPCKFPGDKSHTPGVQSVLIACSDKPFKEQLFQLGGGEGTGEYL